MMVLKLPTIKKYFLSDFPTVCREVCADKKNKESSTIYGGSEMIRERIIIKKTPNTQFLSLDTSQSVESGRLGGAMH